jgi:hypothetical protein
MSDERLQETAEKRIGEHIPEEDFYLDIDYHHTYTILPIGLI